MDIRCFEHTKINVLFQSFIVKTAVNKTATYFKNLSGNISKTYVMLVFSVLLHCLKVTLQDNAL